MKKPDNYDSSDPKTYGNFNSPKAGAYVLGIVGAVEGQTSNGKSKLVLSFDIAEGEFKNHYRELSEKFKKDCYLQLHQVTEGESAPFFKGVITLIEESNTGYKFNFDEKTLLRKLTGAMLKEEFYIDSNGREKSVLKVAFLCSIAKARSGELKVPEPDRSRLNAKSDDGYGGFPPPTDEDQLPF